MMSIKDIGELDRRVVIEESTEARTAEGGITNVWSTYNTVWAKLEDMGGGEAYQADMEKAVKKSVFTVRFDGSINEKMRINYDSRYFDIRLIEEEGRQDFLKLTTIGKNLFTGTSTNDTMEIRHGSESLIGTTLKTITFDSAFASANYDLTVDSIRVSDGLTVDVKITNITAASFDAQNSALNNSTLHYHAFL